MVDDFKPKTTTTEATPGVQPRPSVKPEGEAARPGARAGATMSRPGMSARPGAPDSAGFSGASSAAGGFKGSSFNQSGAGASSGFGAQPQDTGNADLVMSIPVEVQIVLGSTTMPVATLMNLGRGAVITLDKQIGDPVDIVVNGRIIARGEVIVLEDDSSRFGVSLIEVIGK